MPVQKLNAERRSMVVAVSVKPSEFELLKRAAARDSLPVSTWVRMIALRAVKRGGLPRESARRGAGAADVTESKPEKAPGYYESSRELPDEFPK